jgi:hypothetical protein
LMFNFDSRMGFGTNLFRKSNNNTLNYFNIEGGVGLIFVNKARTRNVPIILSQSTSGNVKTTVSIRGGVPAKVRSIIALRGGFQQYNNTLKYDAKNLADSLLTFSANGTTMTYKDIKTPPTGPGASTVLPTIFSDKTNSAVPTVTVDQYGAINITSLYAGLNFRTIRNLLIDVEGYGYRSNIRFSDFFIDFMFSPIVAFKNFKGADGVKYDVKYGNKTPFGWRFGQFVRHPKDQGFSFKWEFGSRPGFKAPKTASVPVNVRNLYFMMTFGLYIPLKIKPIYMGE